MLISAVLFSLASLGSAYRALSDASLAAILGPGRDFDIETGALLAPILRPRVSGTQGNAAVRQHFLDFFAARLPAWHVELHNSTSTTPLSNGKEVPFVNIIATRDPPGVAQGDVSRLALVAHYDSKLTPEGFIGAIDSAAPCAMLLHVARTLDAALTRKWAEAVEDELDAEHTGVQILLLDGEEAFHSWTDTDSLYGARALAEDWETTYHAASSTYRTPLSAISLFVLLDLLGARGPRVPSYFQSTHWAYQHMAHAESRLRSLNLLKSSPNHPVRAAARASSKPRVEPTFLHESTKPDDAFRSGGYVLDDHVPFLQRGVDVLHLIPAPFPRVWHEIEDDGAHLDGDTVEDWARIVAVFAAEWMEVEGFLDGEGEQHVDAEKDEL